MALVSPKQVYKELVLHLKYRIFSIKFNLGLVDPAQMCIWARHFLRKIFIRFTWHPVSCPYTLGSFYHK